MDQITSFNSVSINSDNQEAPFPLTALSEDILQTMIGRYLNQADQKLLTLAGNRRIRTIMQKMKTSQSYRVQKDWEWIKLNFTGVNTPEFYGTNISLDHRY